MSHDALLSDSDLRASDWHNVVAAVQGLQDSLFRAIVHEEHGHSMIAERLSHELHDVRQQLAESQHRADVERDGVDGGHLLVAPALRLEQPRVLDGDAGLVGQRLQHEEVALVEVADMVALEVQHSDYVALGPDGYGQL